MGILLRSTSWRAYGWALLTVGLALLLGRIAWPLNAEAPLLFFLVAVLFSAWYGGLGPGLLATLVATAVLASFVLPPFSAWGTSGGELLQLGAFTGVALLLCFLSVTRRQTEAALRESEERYRALFENANDAIVTFTLDGIVTSVNRGLEVMLGWSREELIGQHYRTFSTPASVALGEARTRRFLAGERLSSIFEAAQLCKDGRVVPVEARTRPIRDRKGQVIGFQGIYRDMTARQQAQAALSKEQAYVALLQVIASTANQAPTLEAAMQRCLAHLCAVTRWPVGHLYLRAPETPEELIPTTFWHLEDPAHFTTFRQVTEGTRLAWGEGLPGRVLASGKPAWIVDVTQDPNFPRARAATELGVKAGFAFPLVAGREVVGVLEFFSSEAREPDEPLLQVMASVGIQLGRVIERQGAEEALRRSELQFRSVADSAPDAIIVADSGGTMRYWNKGAQSLFGYGADEVRGQPLTWLMPERYRAAHRQGLDRVRATGQSRLSGATVELQGLRKDGSEFPMELSLATWQGGTERFYSGIIRDLTARKQTEEALRAVHDELEQRVQERTAELVHTNATLQAEITARQHAEASLRESEARLQAILDNTPALIYLKDLAGQYLLTNRSQQFLTHTTRDQVKGKTDYELFPPELAARFQRNDQAVLASGKPLQFEEVAADEDGLHTYLSEKFLLYDTAGAPYAVCGISLDITARKRIEVALQESEARYRLLFEQNPHPMWIYDVATLAFLAVNDAAVHHYGYAREEFLAMTIQDIRPAEDVAPLLEAVARTPAGFKAPDQWRHRKKDGALIAVEITSHGLEFAGRPARMIVAQDITERKRLEAALQEERHVLEVTLASIGDAVIATDATATLTFINPAAQTLTGWTAQDAIGRKITEVFSILNEHSRQPVDNPVDRVLREGKVVGLANHTVLLTCDGREVPIADSGAPIQSPSGQVYGTVLVFRDITESKQAEVALIRAKEAAEVADRTKSEFLATMSHELRTPLNVILGYTDMLIEGGVGDLPAAQVDVVRRIDRNSRVLFELISMVLDLNRLEAGRLPVDVKAVHVAPLLAEIKGEMQGLCDQSGLACIWQVAANLPPLHTDLGKLKVVIKNLVSNAVKFTKEGSVTVNAQAQRGGVEFRVTDTGIGIPPDALTLIFEPFRQVDSSDTRPYSGSGLGLHIVQRLLEVLGGTITVESEVGQGSTFRVWLPTERSAATR